MTKKRSTKKKPTPKKPMLLHVRHTGKRHTNANTSYPLLVFMLLTLGALLASLTFRAYAEDVRVLDARVPGVAPTQPALIDSSVTNATVTEVPFSVTGTCPSAMVVKLYRNGAFSGAAMCDAKGKFGISTDLFAGTNNLQTRVFNLGDTEGPTSAAISVTYNPAGISLADVTSSTATTPTQPGELPFVIKTDVLYHGYYVGDNVQWRFIVEGGTSPYAVSSDWGDGKSSVTSIKSPGVFEVSHVYGKPGSYKGGYPIKLQASDGNGKKTFMQVVAIVNHPNGNSTSSSSSTLSPLTEHAAVIWSAYGLVFFMAISFWLGQLRGTALVPVRSIKPHMRSRHL